MSDDMAVPEQTMIVNNITIEGFLFVYTQQILNTDFYIETQMGSVETDIIVNDLKNINNDVFRALELLQVSVRQGMQNIQEDYRDYISPDSFILAINSNRRVIVTYIGEQRNDE